MDDNTFRKVHFLTVAHDYRPTKAWEYSKRLEEDEVNLKDLTDSCKKSEISLVVHGRGKSFDSTIFKLENILDYCIHNTDDSDIVVYLDAFDTAVLANQTEILTKFLVFDKKIVFCSHYMCEPYEPIIDHFPFVDNKLPRFLNSGALIGYAKNIIESIEDMFGEYEIVKKIYGNMLSTSDQFHWCLHYLKNKKIIGIDNRCNIFQELSGVGYSSLYLNQGRLVNQETGTRPCILHGTGASGIKKLKILLGMINNDTTS